MRSLGLTLIYSICSAFFAFAQSPTSGTISGKVLDPESAIVDFANVLLLNPADSSLIKGTLTDEQGAFFFEKVDYGTYLIAASFVGYADTYSSTVELSAATPDLQLQPLTLSTEGVDLDAVVVRTTRPFIELKSDKIVMNIESSPVAAGNTALELLAKAPGVTIDQNNNIALKGRQGVLILVDGKNTYLSNEEVVKMLENMPASGIETIEIMHNPPAKYDAAGNAGIINIQLKKNENHGFNGSVTAGGGIGNFPKANGAIRLNYRQAKWNFFGNYNYWFNKRFQSLDIQRTIPFEGAVTEFDQSNHRVSEYGSHRIKAGFDWYLTEKTTLGALIHGNIGKWTEGAINTNAISGDNPFAYDQVVSQNSGAEDWENLTYNLNFKHQFDQAGKELTIDADYSSYENPNRMDYINNFLSTSNEVVEAPLILRSDDVSDVAIKAIKADYSQPFGENTNFSAGLKASMVSTDNAIDFFVQEEDTWVIDPTNTNQFLYEEDIFAAYANVSTQLGGVGLQVGLRGELTMADGNSVTLDEQFQREYFNLFPSISLSHDIGEAHNLSYAYSRRIDRPTYQDLNPFLYFLDQFTFGKGNQFLQPQYSDNLSVNYGFKQFLFFNFSYSRTTDVMTEILEQDEAEQTTFQTKDNLDLFENFSLNVSTSIPFTQWWAGRFNISSFYNRFDSPSSEGIIQEEQLSAYLYASQNFTLPQDFQAELSGWYQSPMVYGMFDLKDQYSINFGVSKRFWDGKASLKVNVDDIFDTLRFRVNIMQGDIDARIQQKQETRRLNVTFTYQFGNSKVKPARRRGTATEEEQNRVQQGN
ncbi:MAG: outer membrane beta-barrel protein [Bacteroidota bacterium]